MSNAFFKGSRRYELGQLCQIIDCKNRTPPYVDSSDYLVIRTSNVRNGLLRLDGVRYTTKEGFSEWTKRGIPRYGDVLFTREAPVGESCLAPKNLKICLGQRMVLFRPSEDIISSLFLAFYLASSRCKREISKYAIGSTVERMNVEDIYKIGIICPSLREQEKIAGFLDAIATHLTQLRRKHDLLQTYKRGVMQKIFSQQIRFKQADGSPFPDWQKKKLGDVSEKPQYGLGAAAVEFNGKHKYIRITDIDDTTHRFAPNPLTSPESGISPAYRLKENDLLFARTGASVGKSYLYKKEDGEIYFAGYLIRFRLIAANPKLIYYLTLTDQYSKWVFINSMRSGQPGINAAEYSDFSFLLPSTKEQDRIASFLTAIDLKMTAIGRKIEGVEKFKQGLLQKMFV